MTVPLIFPESLAISICLSMLHACRLAAYQIKTISSFNYVLSRAKACLWWFVKGMNLTAYSDMLPAGGFSEEASRGDPQPCNVEEFSSLLARRIAYPEPHFVLFTADLDEIGQPWCPDCARMLDKARSRVREAGGTLLEVQVEGFDSCCFAVRQVFADKIVRYTMVQFRSHCADLERLHALPVLWTWYQTNFKKELDGLPHIK